MRWLAVAGAQTDEALRDEVQGAIRGPNYKRGLRDLAIRRLDREYRVVADGAAIAGLTSEDELAPEIRSLLTELADAGVE